VREAYLARAKKYNERFRVVDAEPALARVEAQIRDILDALLKSS